MLILLNFLYVYVCNRTSITDYVYVLSTESCVPSAGSSLLARLPCFELLWTNMLSEIANNGPSTATWVDITTWIKEILFCKLKYKSKFKNYYCAWFLAKQIVSTMVWHLIKNILAMSICWHFAFMKLCDCKWSLDMSIYSIAIESHYFALVFSVFELICRK